jgi:hypothetical protein
MGLVAGTYGGLTPVFTAAGSGGDRFLNRDGRTYFHIKNGDDASMTVTFDSRLKCGQGHEHDVTVTVPAAVDDVPGEKLIGPFQPAQFSDGDDLVNVSYSAVTDVKVAAFSLAEQGR